MAAAMAQGPSETADSPMMADGGQAYTTHIEPADQGGEEYVRCTGCGWELLTELGGWDNLPHASDCPNMNVSTGEE